MKHAWFAEYWPSEHSSTDLVCHINHLQVIWLISAQILLEQTSVCFLTCLLVGVSNLWADHSQEESDGQDSSMVQRPIVIASSQRHKFGSLLSVNLWNGKGLERKVVPPGVKPKAPGLSCQCPATELWHTTATATPLSRYDSLKVIVWMNAVMLCSWCE